MTRLCRTFQTAPAAVPKEDSAKYLRSGLQATGFEAPDWLVPDLEDGTAPDLKPEALENVVDLLGDRTEFPGEIHPRVQWSYADEGLRDAGREEMQVLAREVGSAIDGVVVPKVGRVDDVERAIDAVHAAEDDADLPRGTLDCSLIVETARARSDLRAIAALAADTTLTALVFGPVDYTAELGGRSLDGTRPDWQGTLEALSIEASANDLLAIGGPYDDLFVDHAGVTVYNAAGYADHVRKEATVGLDGSWSLYPKQTVQANRIHTPTTDELDRAVSKIERFQDAKSDGTGAVTLDGQMVDEATFKTFANTVQAVQTVHDRRPEQTQELYDDELLERALAVDAEF
jgi:beta-methylmalyl-CoA/(S)-malyl-CoA lyase